MSVGRERVASDVLETVPRMMFANVVSPFDDALPHLVRVT